MTKKDVARIVQGYLEGQEHPDGLTSTVQEQDIRRRNGFWYVPVLANAEPRRMYAYFEVLAEVETLVEEKENLDILFAPMFPDEVPIAA